MFVGSYTDCPIARAFYDRLKRIGLPIYPHTCRYTLPSLHCSEKLLLLCIFLPYLRLLNATLLYVCVLQQWAVCSQSKAYSSFAPTN